MIKSTRNSHATAMNPYQGKSKKVLTVCSAGVLRSPSVAKILGEEYGYNTRSCGLDETFALIPISTALIEWAEEIVFVHAETYKYALVTAPYDNVKKMLVLKAVVLDIPDQYEYMSDSLQKIIKDQYPNAIKKKEREDNS